MRLLSAKVREAFNLRNARSVGRKLHRAIVRFRNRVSWRLGYGHSAGVFVERYRSTIADAWGYLLDPVHEERVECILKAIPENTLGTILEVGCAEGFVTRRLSSRATEVVACDISDEAIRRARLFCDGLTNLQFHCLDIRKEIPGHDLKLCLISDVIYYLSNGEISKFATELAKRMNPSGLLVLANEWNDNYCTLTHPKAAIEIITDTRQWHQVFVEQKQQGGSAHFWIAVFRMCSSPHR